MKNIRNKDFNNQGQLEQSLLSLTNEDGKKVKEKDALNNLINKLQKTEDVK